MNYIYMYKSNDKEIFRTEATIQMIESIIWKFKVQKKVTVGIKQKSQRMRHSRVTLHHEWV